jgi:hypothetical protein
METLLNLIGIALFANWLTHWFTPITPYRDKLIQKAVNMMVKGNILWAQPLLLPFTCAKCLAFWATLIYTHNFFYALVGSLFAQCIYWLIKKTNYVE